MTKKFHKEKTQNLLNKPPKRKRDLRIRILNIGLSFVEGCYGGQLSSCVIGPHPINCSILNKAE